MVRCAGTVHESYCTLLLPHHPPEVDIGEVKEAFQLGHPVFADFASRMRSAGFVQQQLSFLLVGPRHVEGMFQGCLVLESRIVFHDTSLVPFPGRFQRLSWEVPGKQRNPLPWQRVAEVGREAGLLGRGF